MDSFRDVFEHFDVTPVGGATGSFAMAAQTVGIAQGIVRASYAEGQQVEVLLTENVTGFDLLHLPYSGAVMEIILTQDATGGRTVAWPVSWLCPGGFKPEVSPYPGSVSRILVSTAAGRVFLDFAGLDYR